MFICLYFYKCMRFIMNLLLEDCPACLTHWPLLFLVPDPPLIDLSNSKVYNEAAICWRLPEDHQPTDHQILEYRRWVRTQRPWIL